MLHHFHFNRLHRELYLMKIIKKRTSKIELIYIIYINIFLIYLIRVEYFYKSVERNR